MGIKAEVLERLAALRSRLERERSSTQRRKRGSDIRVMVFPPNAAPKSTGTLAMAPQPIRPRAD
jgi:hypothetical protein